MRESLLECLVCRSKFCEDCEIAKNKEYLLTREKLVLLRTSKRKAKERLERELAEIERKLAELEKQKEPRE